MANNSNTLLCMYLERYNMPRHPFESKGSGLILTFIAELLRTRRVKVRPPLPLLENNLSPQLLITNPVRLRKAFSGRRIRPRSCQWQYWIPGFVNDQWLFWTSHSWRLLLARQFPDLVRKLLYNKMLQRICILSAGRVEQRYLVLFKLVWEKNSRWGKRGDGRNLVVGKGCHPYGE